MHAAHATRMLVHVLQTKCVACVRVVVVVTSSTHFRRCHWAFSASHGLKHTLQSAGIYVHVLRAFRFASGIVVNYVVLVLVLMLMHVVAM